MRRLIYIISTVLATSILGACGQDQSANEAPPVSDKAAIDWADQSAPMRSAPVQLTFGQSHTWLVTGETVTVGSPVWHPKFFSVPVMIYNGGTTPIPVGNIDASIMFNGTINNQPLNPVTVIDSGFRRPSGYINPSKTLQYSETYELPSTPVGTADVQIIASGTMGDPTRPAVIFEGTV